MNKIEKYRRLVPELEFEERDGTIYYKDELDDYCFHIEDREDYYPRIPEATAEKLRAIHQGEVSAEALLAILAGDSVQQDLHKFCRKWGVEYNTNWTATILRMAKLIKEVS